jgi:hypothetical protein
VKLVFTHENSLIVGNIYNILEQNQIQARLKNRYASGGAGDIAPHETWPELWVENDDFDLASQIIADINTQLEQYWRCPKCNEQNPQNFEICWQCQYEKEN